MADDLVYASLSHVAGLIERREASPVELTRIALERVERLNVTLNAFITILAERAMDEARDAENEIARGNYRGPLHGIPYSLKDLIETEGILTTAGSPILKDYMPTHDAAVYERLSAAGGVLLGKNAMLEFAYGLPHPDFGLTHNPWGLHYSTSGSSSGSGASVAAGIGYGSIGSDTGGSIRIPAAWCNLIGVKPTHGRVSLAGVIPLATSLDHVGPMARTARDAAILLQVIAGYDPGDLHSANVPVPDYVALLDQPLVDVRIGVDYASIEDAVEPQIVQAIIAALDVLRDLGMTIVPVKLPDPARASAANVATMMAEAAEYHEQSLVEQPELFSDGVRLRLQRGLESRGIDYVRAQRERLEIRAAYSALFETVDVLLTPTTVVNPITLDELRSEMTLPTSTPMNRRTRFTGPINLIGFPAVSIPCGMTDNGLPIGMQVIARPFDEATLLAIADRYGRESGWTERHPDV